MIAKQVYSEFQTPTSLQTHMLRVAALAQKVCGHWSDAPIDAKAIIQTCLFHDIAKPLTFDLTKQAQFGTSQEDIEKLASLQTRIRERYGKQEHQAAVKICQQIGCSEKSLQLLNNLEWEYAPRLLAENDIESLIPIYCDMRIGPKGILPLTQRMDELKQRTGNGRIDEYARAGKQIEDLIQTHTTIDLTKITHQEIEDTLPSLLQTSV